ncbi:MAG: isochorismatase family cysteine hydrolase [Pseudomonadota bacterium]
MREAERHRSNTALVLIDVQNSFFHPDGENYYAESAAVVPKLEALLEHARAQGCTVVHVAERHRPGLDDFEQAKLPQHCMSGDWNSRFLDGFGPKDEAEFLLEKRRMSAFFGTDLDLLLREKGIRNLVIAGVKTNVCVRATVQDAFSLGYACHVAGDATNSNRAALAAAALEDIDRYMGWIVDTDEAKGLLS